MTLFLVPQPKRATGFIRLTPTKTGVGFRKHILNLGAALTGRNGKSVIVDAAFYQRLVDGLATTRPTIPLADGENKINEDPSRNLGEVTGLSLDRSTGRIYADLDIRDPDAVPRMGSTYLGSCVVVDSTTGTLQSVAVTNRPSGHYEGFKRQLAATGAGDVLALTETGVSMPATTLVPDKDMIEKAVYEVAQQLGCSSEDILGACGEFAGEPDNVSLSASQITAGLRYINDGLTGGLLLSDDQAITDPDDEVLRLSDGAAAPDDDPDDEVTKVTDNPKHSAYFHKHVDDDPDAAAEGKRLYKKHFRNHGRRAKKGAQYPALHDVKLSADDGELPDEAVARLVGNAPDLFRH